MEKVNGQNCFYPQMVLKDSVVSVSFAPAWNVLVSVYSWIVKSLPRSSWTEGKSATM